MLASISSVKSMRSEYNKITSASEKATVQRQLALQKRLREAGLAGQRLGKHAVQEGEVIVQLGEELSESLRGLKVRLFVLRGLSSRALNIRHF